MYAHPHPRSATLLKDVAKPWRRHMWWHWGLVPHCGRAGSGRDTGEKKNMMKEMKIKEYLADV